MVLRYYTLTGVQINIYIVDEFSNKPRPCTVDFGTILVTWYVGEGVGIGTNLCESVQEIWNIPTVCNTTVRLLFHKVWFCLQKKICNISVRAFLPAIRQVFCHFILQLKINSSNPIILII